MRAFDRIFFCFYFCISVFFALLSFSFFSIFFLVYSCCCCFCRLLIDALIFCCTFEIFLIIKFINFFFLIFLRFYVFFCCCCCRCGDCWSCSCCCCCCCCSYYCWQILLTKQAHADVLLVHPLSLRLLFEVFCCCCCCKKWVGKKRKQHLSKLINLLFFLMFVYEANNKYN